MKNALMGLITGFAKGTSDRITEERADEKSQLSNRFKMAAINKKQRDIEDQAKKEKAEERNDQINTFYAGASLAQRLAMMSNETMFNLAIENKEALSGEANKEKLDKFIVVNEDKIPKNWKTVQDYIASLKSAPQAAATMQDEQTREVFGFRVTPNQAEMDGIASQFGSTAAELQAYENMPAASSSPVLGSVNLDVLKTPEKLGDQIEEARQSLVGATPEEAVALKAKIEELIVHQNVGLSPKTLAADAERISLRMKNATGTELANLKAELSKVNGLIRSNTEAQKEAKQAGGDDLTFAQRKTAVQDAQISAIESMTGLNQVQKDRLVEKYKDSVTGEERTRMVKLKPTDLPIIWKIAKESALQAIKDLGQIKPDGTYTQEAIGILVGLGLYRNGKIVEGPTVEGPTVEDPKVDPAAPAAPAPKTATMAQVEAIAKKNNLSVDAVKADMESKGFIIK